MGNCDLSGDFVSTCTFFGHRDTSEEIEPILKNVLIDLIENKNVKIFYVGNHGNFDYIVRKTLKELQENYTHIKYSVVLAYHPTKKGEFDYKDFSDTIYPFDTENIPPKFAIVKRNKWMIEKSTYVVCNIKYITGGAAECKRIAERKGKIVINLANISNHNH